MKVSDYFEGTFARELLNFMATDFLGTGIGRHVYAFGPDSELVIKFEIASRSFQNVMEWELYNEYKDNESISKWLAPCVQISPCGLMLLQKRTLPLRGPEEFPDEVPVWLTDLKKENWGMYEGRPVMHDYGFLSFNLSRKMKAHPDKPKKEEVA